LLRSCLSVVCRLMHRTHNFSKLTPRAIRRCRARMFKVPTYMRCVVWSHTLDIPSKPALHGLPPRYNLGDTVGSILPENHPSMGQFIEHCDPSPSPWTNDGGRIVLVSHILIVCVCYGAGTTTFGVHPQLTLNRCNLIPHRIRPPLMQFGIRHHQASHHQVILGELVHLGSPPFSQDHPPSQCKTREKSILVRDPPIIL